MQLFNVLLLLSFLLCSRVKVAVMIFLFLKSMFWWTTPTPLDMGCCPLWMLSLDITRSRWPRKTERKRRLSPTFCYKVMPFGLKNAGATYQRAMTALFHDMIHKEVHLPETHPSPISFRFLPCLHASRATRAEESNCHTISVGIQSIGMTTLRFHQ